MIRVCFVRGKYLNNFEGQNYQFEKKEVELTAVSSLFPLHRQFNFPVIKLLSPLDFPFFKSAVKYMGNRILGDAQMLIGLEMLADKAVLYHTADPHYYYSFQLAKLKQKKLIKKLIVTAWETIPYNNESVAKKRKLKYFTLSQADYFICYTEKAKKTLIVEGVGPDKISVVKLGVDLNQFKSQSSYVKTQNQNSKLKTITILFVGRLVEEKGILDLYEAYRNVKTQMSKVNSTNQILKLRYIGDGSLRRKLAYFIRRDRLENYVTIEKKEYEEMPNVYQEADIFVLPSKRTKTWEEQYGMVLVEAMASGLPIVAYDSGSISEIMGNTGILISEGSKNDLYTMINRLIIVKKLRLKLGKMGRKRAEKVFDSKKTAKKIAEIYKKIVNS